MLRLGTMNTLHRSWDDGTLDPSDDVTRPGDVLALTGERPANDAPAFSVAGPPPAVLRVQLPGRVVTTARGIVKRTLEDRLVLGKPGRSSDEVHVGYALPASIDLRPLAGRRVHLTLDEEEAAPDGRVAQTLAIRTHDDHLWLVARRGCLRDDVHAFAGAPAPVTVSPKEGGPVVVSVADLPTIVAPGGEARFRIGESRYVVELVSRDERGARPTSSRTTGSGTERRLASR